MTLSNKEVIWDDERADIILQKIRSTLSEKKDPLILKVMGKEQKVLALDVALRGLAVNVRASILDEDIRLFRSLDF